MARYVQHSAMAGYRRRITNRAGRYYMRRNRVRTTSVQRRALSRLVAARRRPGSRLRQYMRYGR